MSYSYYYFIIIDININSGNGEFQGYYIDISLKNYIDIINNIIFNNSLNVLNICMIINLLKKSQIINIYDSLIIYTSFIVFKIIYLNDDISYEIYYINNLNGFLYLTMTMNTILNVNYITNPRLLIYYNNNIYDYSITNIEYLDNNFEGFIVNENINDLIDNYSNGDIIYNEYDNKFYIKVILDNGQNNLGLIPTNINNTLAYITDKNTRYTKEIIINRDNNNNN